MKTQTVLFCIFAIASAAFAADEIDTRAAQVYDVTISIKTTAAAKGKVSAKKNPFIGDSSTTITYRKQATQKWIGLIWGCDCESIRGVWQSYTGGGVSGCVIWNSKSPYDILYIGDINWRLLNAIDANGNKCEGSWTIGDSGDESNAFLAFSGFGTLSLSAIIEDGVSQLVNCTSNIKSISGNVAGWMPAPSTIKKGKPSKCTFCGIVDPGEEDTEDLAEAWNFCECAAEIGDSEFTTVYGTWSIKYSNALSKKLISADSILDVYKKFPDNVKAAVSGKISEIAE